MNDLKLLKLIFKTSNEIFFNDKDLSIQNSLLTTKETLLK